MSRPSLGADEAIARVHDGDTLLVGGFEVAGPPISTREAPVGCGGRPLIGAVRPRLGSMEPFLEPTGRAERRKPTSGEDGKWLRWPSRTRGG